MTICDIIKDNIVTKCTLEIFTNINNIDEKKIQDIYSQKCHGCSLTKTQCIISAINIFSTPYETLYKM